MCGDTLFEVTAQTARCSSLSLTMVPGDPDPPGRLAHLRNSLKTGADAYGVGHVHGFSGGHNRC